MAGAAHTSANGAAEPTRLSTAFRSGEGGFNSVCKPRHQAEPSRGLWRSCGANLGQPRAPAAPNGPLRPWPRHLQLATILGADCEITRRPPTTIGDFLRPLGRAVPILERTMASAAPAIDGRRDRSVGRRANTPSFVEYQHSPRALPLLVWRRRVVGDCPGQRSRRESGVLLVANTRCRRRSSRTPASMTARYSRAHLARRRVSGWPGASGA
jgi:hypothetical protein